MRNLIQLQVYMQSLYLCVYVYVCVSVFVYIFAFVWVCFLPSDRIPVFLIDLLIISINCLVHWSPKVFFLVGQMKHDMGRGKTKQTTIV